MSTETIIDQYERYDGAKRLQITEDELREIILIAKIEEVTRWEFTKRIGSGWKFTTGTGGLYLLTWDLERTLEENRPRNLTSAEIDGEREADILVGQQAQHADRRGAAMSDQRSLADRVAESNGSREGISSSAWVGWDPGMSVAQDILDICWKRFAATDVQPADIRSLARELTTYAEGLVPEGETVVALERSIDGGEWTIQDQWTDETGPSPADAQTYLVNMTDNEYPAKFRLVRRTTTEEVVG